MSVWFITGCSTGIGYEIAVAALARGDKVVATARNASKLMGLESKGALILSLDITSPEKDVAAVVAKAVEKFGRIDILVNNAGQALAGAFEETSDQEIRSHLDVNFFGHLTVTRAVLPIMRAQKQGTIGFIGSVGGWYGETGASAYFASKWAIAGFALSLRDEVKPFGINITVIEPGYFRTNLLASDPFAKVTMQEYKTFMDPMKEMTTIYSGKQPGDPAKGAEVIVDALKGVKNFEGKVVPGRLLLGSDAVASVEGILETQKISVEEWKTVSVTTDF